MTDEEIWETYADNIRDDYQVITLGALEFAIDEFFGMTLSPLIKVTLADFIWDVAENVSVPYEVTDADR